MFASHTMKRTNACRPERASSFFQPKLTVNRPNDRYELEADAVAEKVMRMNHPATASFFKPAVSAVQRTCGHCEEAETSKLQRKEAGAAHAADSSLDYYIGNLSGGRPLPEDVRSFYQSRMGVDFGNVKIHTDSVAAKSAQSIHARAYTTGNNVVFNGGQYSPETDGGKRLLAHELVHVIQQGSADASASPVRKKGLYGQDCESAPAAFGEREEEEPAVSKPVQAKLVLCKRFEGKQESNDESSGVSVQENASTTNVIQRFSLDGFPAAEEAQMRAAIPVAASTVGSCKGLKKTVVDKINNAAYLFKPDLDICGKTYPFPWADIRIGPKAFDTAKCCTLASTIAHEASHTQFFTEGEARALECSCFTCSC